jgi:uncharacterized protein DUF1707
MARRSQLRASDADREYVAEQLRNAAGEGRLRAQELEHRLEAAFAAKTYGELNAVISDLPREAPAARPTGRLPIHLRPATVFVLLLLLPLALAVAAAAVMAVAALLTAWALAVTVAGLILGPRFRALRSPWAVASRTRQLRRGNRGQLGGPTPWL